MADQWRRTTFANLPITDPVDVRFNGNVVKRCYGVLVGRNCEGAWQDAETGNLYDYGQTEWKRDQWRKGEANE